MWGSADAFYFVWKQVSGDVTLAADIEWVGTSEVGHRKAVLMVRQSLDPGAAYADAVSHGDGLTSLQFRGAAKEQTVLTLTESSILRRYNRHRKCFARVMGVLARVPR
jgi:hypothetical protein